MRYILAFTILLGQCKQHDGNAQRAGGHGQPDLNRQILEKLKHLRFIFLWFHVQYTDAYVGHDERYSSKLVFCLTSVLPSVIKGIVKSTTRRRS